MAKIIKNGGQRLRDEFEIVFYYTEEYGGMECSHFSCSIEGIPDICNMRDQRCYDTCCTTGEWEGKPLKTPVIEEYSRLFQYPAVLQCDCGKIFPLIAPTIRCECGCIYNNRGEPE